MNSNNFNPYSYPQSNVGSGWSANFSNPGNNQFDNPTQNFNSLGNPPPIGFILSNSSNNSAQQCQYPQPVNSNPSQINYQQTNSIRQSQQTIPTAPNYNQPNISKINSQSPINRPSEQLNYNPVITTAKVDNHPTNLNDNMKSAQKEIDNSSKLRTDQIKRQNNANIQSSNRETKTEYQKGLDKLAELMNEDLTPEEMNKLNKSYGNN